MNIYKLNNILLNNLRVKKGIIKEILKYYKLNENEYKTYYNLWTDFHLEQNML